VESAPCQPGAGCCPGETLARGHGDIRDQRVPPAAPAVVQRCSACGWAPGGPAAGISGGGKWLCGWVRELGWAGVPGTSEHPRKKTAPWEGDWSPRFEQCGSANLTFLCHLLIPFKNKSATLGRVWSPAEPLHPKDVPFTWCGTNPKSRRLLQLQRGAGICCRFSAPGGGCGRCGGWTRQPRTGPAPHLCSPCAAW